MNSDRGSRAASSATRRPANRCRPRADRRPVRWCRSAARRRRAPCRSSRTPRRSASRRESSARVGSRSTVQPRASLMRPPTSRSISGEVSGKRLSARRADTRNDRDRPVAEVARGSPRAIASTSSGARPARAKFAMPNTRDTRSRTVAPVRRRRRARISIRPISDAHLAHVECPWAPRAGCARAVAMNHGRFLPLSASSW